MDPRRSVEDAVISAQRCARQGNLQSDAKYTRFATADGVALIAMPLRNLLSQLCCLFDYPGSALDLACRPHPRPGALSP